MTTAACLNLVGDGDEVAVLLAVEKAFGVTLPSEETSRCETVGQLFEAVSAELNISEARGLGCPTAIAFFRLRAALRGSSHMRRMDSKTDLRPLFGMHGARRLRNNLSKETALEIPPLELASTGVTAMMLILACGVASSLVLVSWLPLFGSLACAFALLFVLPVTVPREIASLGAFAASCAAWNYGKLSERAGGARREDAWNAFTTVVRESSGADFEGEINSKTLLFAEQASSFFRRH